MTGRRVDLILAGVGGQGVLSAAALLADAATREGMAVEQGEVHGMAQRGGAVQATLRMADGPVHGSLVPRGCADLVLGLEPLEALRALDWLAPTGRLVTSTDPHRNIPDYPPGEEIVDMVAAVAGAVLVPATALARRAGLARAANVVMIGAASFFLPLPRETIEQTIRDFFVRMGPGVVDVNVRAFEAGRGAVRTVLDSRVEGPARARGGVA